MPLSMIKWNWIRKFYQDVQLSYRLLVDNARKPGYACNQVLWNAFGSGFYLRDGQLQHRLLGDNFQSIFRVPPFFPWMSYDPPCCDQYNFFPNHWSLLPGFTVRISSAALCVTVGIRLGHVRIVTCRSHRLPGRILRFLPSITSFSSIIHLSRQQAQPKFVIFLDTLLTIPSTFPHTHHQPRSDLFIFIFIHM